MPKRILDMRNIIEVLRLHHEKGLSQYKIAQATSIKRSTLRDYLRRARAAELTWPLPANMSNTQLNELLFPVTKNKLRKIQEAPNWGQLHQELKRKGVTLQLLWEEYKRDKPSGFQYSWFAHQYRLWAKEKEVWMHQHYKAGEKAFVDYSGLTAPIWKKDLSEIDYYAEVFVGVLGASDLIFCRAYKSQKLPDWIDAHQDMFTYFGGVPEMVVPDNLRSGVTKAHRYEPVCNQSYEEAMHHYGCVIMPTRSYKPRDKAKAEKSVQIVQRRILAALRDRQCVSLEECNEAINALLIKVNETSFQKLPYSRRSLFETVEKKTLSPLPDRPYEFGEWVQLRVTGSYHLCIHHHHYSVPHTLVKKTLDIRISQKVVECFHKGERICLHQRDDTPQAYTTLDEHMPESHRQQNAWHQERLLAWAQSIGPHTDALIKQLFADAKRHIHQKERSAVGILRLSESYGNDAFEKSCKTALKIGSCRYDSIESILKCRLYQKDTCETPMESQTSTSPTTHDNIRGADYYN